MAKKRAKPGSWRKTLVFLHRDVGYLCLGLTIAYAVSGIAVNHRHHWDYNFSEKLTDTTIGTPAQLLSLADGEPGQQARDHQDALVDAIVVALDRDTPPKRVFWRRSDGLSLFWELGERNVVDYNPLTGVATHIQRRPRLLISQFNQLHLNEHRAVWTWFGDLYALALMFLAISGAIVLKGKKGIKGRGGILALIGIVIPLLALLLFS